MTYKVIAIDLSHEDAIQEETIAEYPCLETAIEFMTYQLNTNPWQDREFLVESEDRIAAWASPLCHDTGGEG